MELAQKSGLPFPTRPTRIILKAFEQVLGKNDWNGILNLADLGFLIDHPKFETQECKFALEDLAAIHSALEQIYGRHGERSVALRAGKETFQLFVSRFGLLSRIVGLISRIIPPKNRIRFCLNVLVKKTASYLDSPLTIKEEEESFVLTFSHCPFCRGRAGIETPVCHFITGFLQGLMQWIGGGKEFRINETKCCATSEPVCEFTILTDPIST